MKKTYLLIAGMLLSILSVNAQVEDQKVERKYKKSIFGNGGLGGANQNIALQTSFIVEPKRTFIVGGSFDLNFDVNGEHDDPLRNGASTLSVFGGAIGKASFGVVYVGAGPAICTITHPRENHRQETSLGLKVSSGLFFSFRYGGFGLSPFCVLNGDNSYGGVTLNLAGGLINVRTAKKKG